MPNKRKRKKRKRKRQMVDVYLKKPRSADDDKGFLRMTQKNPQVGLMHKKTSHKSKNGSKDCCDAFAKESSTIRKRRKNRKKQLSTGLDLQKIQEADNGNRCRAKLCLTSEANALDDIKANRKRKVTVDNENDVSEECIVKKQKKRKYSTHAADYSESQDSVAVDPEKKQTSEDDLGIKISGQKLPDSDGAQKATQDTSKSAKKCKKKRKKAQTPKSHPSSSNDLSTNNESCETGKTGAVKGDNWESAGLVTSGAKEKPSSGINWSIPDSDDDEDKEWMKDLPFDPKIWLSVCREGADLKKGRWSGLEDNILRENVNCFCKKYKIEDPRPVVLPILYSDRRDICKFNRATNFYIRICKGLKRLPVDAYFRARKIFDEQNYKGKFTEEEIATIKHLTKFYGNKWNRIGREIGRSGQSVLDKYRNTKEGNVRGKWSKKETKQLIQAVKSVTGCDDGEIIHQLVGIPWRKVHKMVPTRTLHQCLLKWKETLCWSVGNRMKHTWTPDDSVKLIESIYGLEVNDESDIDWLALHQKFWERSPSPTKLIKVWTALKLKYLSKNYHFMTFEDILDELYHKALPVLRKRVFKLQTKIKSAEFVSDSGDSSSDSSEDEWW